MLPSEKINNAKIYPFLSNRNVRYVPSFGIFARSVQRVIDCHFIYVLSTKSAAATIAIDVHICPRYNNTLSIPFPLIDQKILYFCGPGDNKEAL